MVHLISLVFHLPVKVDQVLDHKEEMVPVEQLFNLNYLVYLELQDLVIMVVQEHQIMDLDHLEEAVEQEALEALLVPLHQDQVVMVKIFQEFFLVLYLVQQLLQVEEVVVYTQLTLVLVVVRAQEAEEQVILTQEVLHQVEQEAQTLEAVEAVVDLIQETLPVLVVMVVQD